MKIQTTVLTTLALVAGLAVTTVSFAQFAKTEDAIKYRQSALTVMGTHFGRLAGMARGAIPYDAAKAQESARIAATVGHLPWEGFVANSFAAPAKVKGDIGANMADFKALQEKAEAELDKLPGAAGNLDSLKAQVGATGGACKNCHDKYRQTN
jgi:cytochrome c556